MTLSLKDWGLIGAGALIVALLIALLTTRATLADQKRGRVKAEAEAVISRGSVDRLTAEIKRMTAEQFALATDDAARKRAANENLALIDAASEVRQATIERLKQSAEAVRPAVATETLPAECRFSEATLADWK